MTLRALLISLLLTLTASQASAICNKRFLNPITEICWDCIFPISVGGLKVNLGTSRPDTKNQSLPLCLCPGLPPRLGPGHWSVGTRPPGGCGQ